MDQIIGKTLVFADFHLGLKQGSKSRLKICVDVIKKIIQTIKDNNIQQCIFCGDWHHVRNSTENNVLNVSYRLMQALQKNCKVYCILGNHDLYLKNSTDISSLIIFKDLPNVKIIDKPEEISINGNKSILVPWLGDLSGFGKNTFDMMFGHFDVSAKYLMKSYMQEHKTKTAVTTSVATMIDKSLDSAANSAENPGDFVGDFVDVLKDDGICFSGHIHGRKEFISKGRKFIIVGDPYQQNLGEISNNCGYYIIDENNQHEFYEITGVPVHINLKMSEIVKDISKFDFNIVKGNIIHKIYDVDVDPKDDAKITQKINDLFPYEELLPDYEVSIADCESNTETNSSINLIRKSKLEYIHSYINNIDQKTLDEQHIDKSKLFQFMSEYYNTVTEDN